MAADVRRFAERLTKASQALVRTAYGTDLRFSLEGRPGQADDGLFLEAGRWGNLPSGEAYAVPVEGSGQGLLVVPAGWYPGLDQEMTFQFEAGLVVALQGGGQVGESLRQALRLESDEPLYKARRNLAELGVGCNPNARQPDNVLEAEKIKSTIHIGVGDNLHMGGLVEADFHEDFVQPEVDLVLDEEVVIERGEWRV
jgi:leucyl aminopeptidase (aminopeptidase T)